MTRATGSSFRPRRQYASFSIFLSRAHTFSFSAPSHHLAKGVAEAAGVVSIAHIEQPPLFHLLPGGRARWSPTARVQRGSSETARCTSTGGHLVCPLILLPSSLVISQGWGLIDLPLRAAFSPTHPLADTFHPPYPPIASQSISRDVPLTRARAFYSLFSHT